MAVIGALFAIIVVKQIFGGIGQNIMNQTEDLLEEKSDLTHTHNLFDLEDAPYDTVVASGVINGWRYRKWNSGYSECWTTFQLYADKDYGEGATVRSNVAIPQGMFLANDYVFFFQPVLNAAKIRKVYTVAGNTKENLDMFIKLENKNITGLSGAAEDMSGAISANDRLGIQILVRGHWK